MSDVLQFAGDHRVVVTFALCWLLSCFAESMPKPRQASSPFYLWIFSFLHLVTGAIPRLIALTFPFKYAQLFNETLQQPTEQPTDPLVKQQPPQ